MGDKIWISKFLFLGEASFQVYKADGYYFATAVSKDTASEKKILITVTHNTQYNTIKKLYYLNFCMLFP